MEDEKEKTPPAENPPTDEPDVENPAPEEPEKDEPDVENPATKSTEELFAAIEAKYNEKLEAVKQDYEKQLADQKKIIIQLLDGTPPKQHETAADRINARRNIKKW